MKLDSVRNIKIYEKSLYAEQLYCYSRLCELYRDLAILQGPNITSEQMQDKFSTILSIATSGNLDDYITSEFSKKEIDILKEYSEVSRTIQ